MNQTLRQQIKNPGLAIIIAAGLLLVVAKLLLASAQNVFLWPDEAVLDDMVMYDGAVSIAGGGWLGEYGFTTLSKHSFFSLWLAGLHVLGIPYLLGGQLLWAAASLALAAAVAPLFKSRWMKLALFAVLLFSPSSTANPYETASAEGPLAFVTRVYRDNIFPALCMLCIAGMVGFAFRYRERLRRSVWWLVLAGLAFAACWLCREDGWWLMPFMVAAALVTMVFIVRGEGAEHEGGLASGGGKHPEPDASRTAPRRVSDGAQRRGGTGAARRKLLRCTALALPFALLAAGVLSWCAANYSVYGRFIVSDFTQGEFADAYGAMTRVEHEDWNPKVDVPRDVREKLYAHVPAMAELEPILEGERFLEKYAGGGDYSSGAFYWALREAAADLGHYDTPQKAQVFFESLAVDINALCDDGTLPADRGRRSSVNPPIRAEYIGPVLAEGLYGVAFCAVFAQCDARSLFSPGGNNPAYYAEKLEPMETFLHEKALTATKENSIEPYYSPWQRLCFGVLDAVRYIYAVLTPLALAAALAWQVGAIVHGRRPENAGQRKAEARCDGRRTDEPPGRGPASQEQNPPDLWLLWFVQLGLLFCILLRAFMIAFVTVSSFTLGTYVMYLASIHPIMLVFAFVGAVQWVKLLRERHVEKAARKAGDA